MILLITKAVGTGLRPRILGGGGVISNRESQKKKKKTAGKKKGGKKKDRDKYIHEQFWFPTISRTRVGSE